MISEAGVTACSWPSTRAHPTSAHSFVASSALACLPRTTGPTRRAQNRSRRRCPVRTLMLRDGPGRPLSPPMAEPRARTKRKARRTATKTVEARVCGSVVVLIVDEQPGLDGGRLVRLSLLGGRGNTEGTAAGRGRPASPQRGNGHVLQHTPRRFPVDDIAKKILSF